MKNKTNKKNCQTVSAKMSEVYLREFAASIVELFENLLDKHDVTIPSDEDDQKEADNTARLYGMVYAELEDAVAGILCDFAKKVTESANVVLVDSYNGFSSVDECDKTGTKCVYNGFIEIDGYVETGVSYAAEKKLRMELAKELHDYFLHMNKPHGLQLLLDGIPLPDDPDALKTISECVMRGDVVSYTSVLFDYLSEMERYELEFRDLEVEDAASDLLKRLEQLNGACQRCIKLYTDIPENYLIISTDAPDEIIVEQIDALRVVKDFNPITADQFSLLIQRGYSVSVLRWHDDSCPLALSAYSNSEVSEECKLR